MEKPQWLVKPFSALSTQNLYDILHLRAKVFVLEQECPYLDVDYYDQKSVHLMGVFENRVVCYCRLFDAGNYFETACIGRVVIDPEFRNKKWGHLLMHEAIGELYRLFGEQRIEISAQCYLEQFYASHGFVTISDMYLEDNIPHVRMRLDPKSS